MAMTRDADVPSEEQSAVVGMLGTQPCSQSNAPGRTTKRSYELGCSGQRPDASCVVLPAHVLEAWVEPRRANRS